MSCFYQDLYVRIQLESQLGILYWSNDAIYFFLYYWKKTKKKVLTEIIETLPFP